MPDSLEPVTPAVIDVAPLRLLAARIAEAHAHACASVRAGLEPAREAGSALLEVKERLKHGEFLPWVAAHAQLSTRTAQGYMRVSRKWAPPPSRRKCATSFVFARSGRAGVAEYACSEASRARRRCRRRSEPLGARVPYLV